MKKKFILCLAALSLMGLSACGYDLGDSCNLGDKRCLNNAVQVCTDKQWTTEVQCEPDEICDVTDGFCRATCSTDSTKCTNDGQMLSCQNKLWTITACEDGYICPSDKTVCEEIACQVGDPVCNETNDGIETCSQNSIVETACGNEAPVCNEGRCVVCLNDATRCHDNAIEVCAQNIWTQAVSCKDDQVCDDVEHVCLDAECEAGWQRCNGDKLVRCGANRQYEASVPGCRADEHCFEPVEHHAICVSCLKDAHCKGTEVCDMGSKTCRPRSTITKCFTATYQAGQKTTSGYVYTDKDDTALNAQLLCGQAGQKLSEYQAIAGTQEPDCVLCNEGQYQYTAKLASLDYGLYLCLWSFSQEGEAPVACQIDRDADVISDFESIPTAGEALIYHYEWDQLIDFENFKANSNYDNSESQSIGSGIQVSIIGRISDKDYSIDERTFVASSKYDNSIAVHLPPTAHYIGQLAFDYLGSKEFQEEQTIEIFLNEDRRPLFSLTLRGEIKSRQTLTLPIHQYGIKSFSIKNPKKTSKNDPRLSIDNVRWTDRAPVEDVE